MGAGMRRLVSRIANLWRWRSVDQDLRDEVAHHLAMAAAEHRRRGLDAVAARRQAVREFGGERWLEESRGARGVSWLQDAVRDARFGARQLARQPVFAATVAVVLALAVGATTAVYTVVDGVLLSPLPYEDAEQLHTLLESDGSQTLRLLSYPTFREVAEVVHGAGVAELAWIRGEGVLVRGEDGALNVLGAFVTPNFFDLMGREAAAGRTFDATEASQPVAVVTARLAQRMWGSVQAAVGAVLTTPDGAFTVIGVMPAGFSYPAWADFWSPLHALPAETRYAIEQRDLHVDSDVLVRVPAGVPLERVLEVVAGPIAHAAREHPEAGAQFDRGVLTSLRQRVIGAGTPPLGLLAGAVSLVLLLASVSIAGLMLARGLARRDELAARLALGAGRGRLVRQLVTESVVLGLAGGAAGVVLAWFALAWLHAAAPMSIPRLDEIRLDAGVLAFALTVTLFATLASGVWPALRVTAGVGGVAGALRRAGRGATGDLGSMRLRSGLVVVQIALAVVLLVGASLLVRTARELASLDPGYRADHVVALRVMPSGRYADDGARLRLYEQLRDELRRVPGVEAVALANHIPSTFASMPTVVRTEREPAADENLLALYRSVSWDYLRVIGATPAAGRLPAPEDARGTGIVINETLARREWGSADPLGQPITVFRSAQGAAHFGEPLPSHVVGVIRDMREQGPDRVPAPAVYVPVERNVWGNIHLVVVTQRPLGTIGPALRAAVRAVDPDIPTAGPHMSSEFRHLDDYHANVTQARRFSTTLLTSFAVTALVLAMTGLFGVLAFIVTQRRREIGVRMAIGARRTDAAGLVLRESALLVVAGLAAGLAMSVPATRLLEASLFGVERLDPMSYVLACAAFLLTALLAAGLPAMRAARIDPARALRSD
jgi:putative ABC transport system permease protein